MMTHSYSGMFAPEHLSGVIAGIATVSTSFPRSFSSLTKPLGDAFAHIRAQLITVLLRCTPTTNVRFPGFLSCAHETAYRQFSNSKPIAKTLRDQLLVPSPKRAAPHPVADKLISLFLLQAD